METEVQQVPVFPLPGVVFFPNSLLRLHIFEHRYREMTRDCLDGNRRLVVALPKPGWEPDYFESPSIYRVAGLGRIVDHTELAGGKFNITLEGMDRIQVTRELRQKPYRIAEVERLQGCLMAPEDAGYSTQAVFRELQLAMQRMLQLFPQFKPRYQKILAAHPHPGVVADLLTHYFVKDTYDKQCILEEQNVLRRIKLVNVQILHFIHHYARKQFREGV